MLISQENMKGESPEDNKTSKVTGYDGFFAYIWYMQLDEDKIQAGLFRVSVGRKDQCFNYWITSINNIVTDTIQK